MYSLADHGSMLNDKGRMDAYIKALKRTVNSNSVVLDIGTGTGIFSILACHFGARKVYAVEPDDIIGLAREMAVASGVADRTTFIQDLSTRIDLPEKATILVTDIRGSLPIYTHALESIIDARNRHLVPGGHIIPAQDIIWVALAAAPELYKKYTCPWSKNFDNAINMNIALHKIKNNIWVTRKSEIQLVTNPEQWALLDYYTIEQPDISCSLTWKIEQPDTVHGIKAWFSTILVDDIGYADTPGESEHVYGGQFFPFYEPLNLNPGEIINVNLNADLVGDDYLCRWETSIFADENMTSPRVNFTQSTFEGTTLSLTALQKRTSDYTPQLNQEGLITNDTLKMMAESYSLNEIADYIFKKYPWRFDNVEKALAYIGDISVKYSK